MDNHSKDPNARPRVRPLTRTGEEEVNYERPRDVEAQIQEVLALDPVALAERARILDRKAANYLRDEVIVYFLREAARGEGHDIEVFAEALLRRIRRRVRAWGRSWSGAADWEDYASICIGEVLDRVLDLESDRGDFAEVRFAQFLRRLAIDVHRRQARNQKDAAATDSIDDPSGDTDSKQFEPVEPGPSPEKSVINQEEARLQEKEYARALELLNRLDETRRRVFVLRHVEGMKIESSDPTEVTISSLFGKTPRTIRNWLRECDQQIEAFLKEGVSDE